MHCVSVALTISTLKRSAIAIAEKAKEMVMSQKVSASRTCSVFRRCRNSLFFCTKIDVDEMMVVSVVSCRDGIW